jgi:hypothetical protein
MSSANVEIVRRALAARRSEFEDLLDPSVRLDLSERVFNPAVYEGYDGIMQWRAEVAETWDYYRSEAQEFFEGPEIVVLFTQERGRGKGSGVEVQQKPTALLCRLRMDRVSEIRLYHDRQRALRDAGIEK